MDYQGRLKIIKELCAKPLFSLSVGSKDTRFSDINLDIDEKCSPDIIGTATSLPFKEGAFERVIFTEVIEHLPSYDEIPALREIYRVLNEEGELIFSTPNDVFPYTLLDMARYVGTHRHYKKDYICHLLKSGGFKVQNCFTAGSYWECLVWLWYCLITYPLRKLFRKLPFVPRFMIRLANENYKRINEGGYIIFIRAKKISHKREMQ